MKKILAALLIVLSFATFAFAADSWDTTVMWAANRVKIAQDGAKVLHAYSNLKAGEKEEFGLWKQLWTTKGAERAKTAMTLVNTMFPDGPSPEACSKACSRLIPGPIVTSVNPASETALSCSSGGRYPERTLRRLP